ncbi:MAG: NYN domain-containing protein [Candidatus Aureabacteria bacterium]|nr:NYN domain-containing protein [Candidatus Auribacterota bacterium]
MKKYLIDGYNLLHAWKKEHVFNSKTFDGMREELIRSLQMLADFKDIAIEVYFDGKIRSKDKIEGSPHFKVIFTSKGITADTAIERAVYNAESKKELTIITLDRKIRDLAMALGVLSLNPMHFLADLEEAKREISKLLTLKK